MTLSAPHAWLAIVGVALALAVLTPPAAEAQTGTEIMQKSRQVHRVKDEEEQLLLRLVSESGAIKERRVARWTLNGAGDLDKILIRFLAPRDVENTALLTWEAKDGNDDQWLYLRCINPAPSWPSAPTTCTRTWSSCRAGRSRSAGCRRAR